MIELPDKVTISSVEKFFFWNAAIRPSRSKKGAGKSEFDSSKLAVNESLLPNGTFHLCPPSYTQHIYKYELIILTIKLTN
jgi:hypothetical protein